MLSDEWAVLGETSIGNAEPNLRSTLSRQMCSLASFDDNCFADTKRRTAVLFNVNPHIHLVSSACFWQGWPAIYSLYPRSLEDAVTTHKVH